MVKRYKPYTSHNRSLGIPKPRNTEQKKDSDTQKSPEKDDKTQKKKEKEEEKEKEKGKETEKEKEGTTDTQTLSADPAAFLTQPFSLHVSSSSTSNITQSISQPSNPPLFSPSTQFETLAPHQPESFEFEPLDSQSAIFNQPPSPPSPNSTQAYTPSQPLPSELNNSSFSSPHLTTGLTTQRISLSTQPTQSDLSSFATLEPHQPQSFLLSESTSIPPRNSSSPSSSSSPSPSTSPSKLDSLRKENDQTESVKRGESNLLTQQISFTYTQPTQSPPSTQGTLDPHQPSLDFGDYYTADEEIAQDSEVNDNMDVDGGEEKKDEEFEVDEDIQKEEVKVENTKEDSKDGSTSGKLIFVCDFSPNFILWFSINIFFIK